MKMVGEQVRKLREYASTRKGEIADICREAADTIEMLAEKARDKQWVPVSKRLPKKGEATYLCTARWNSDEEYRTLEIEWGKIADLDQAIVEEIKDGIYDGYAFGEKWSDGIDNVMDVIAWRTLPDPYKEDEK